MKQTKKNNLIKNNLISKSERAYQCKQIERSIEVCDELIKFLSSNEKPSFPTFKQFINFEVQPTSHAIDRFLLSTIITIFTLAFLAKKQVIDPQILDSMPLEFFPLIMATLREIRSSSSSSDLEKFFF